jgi:methanogenic corrinoid protein MtbC1
MQEHINPFKTLAKGLAFKYNIIGTAMNENKYHLLKEIFIIAIICVASLSINRITLWPIALAFVFVGIFFFTS